MVYQLSPQLSPSLSIADLCMILPAQAAGPCTPSASSQFQTAASADSHVISPPSMRSSSSSCRVCIHASSCRYLHPSVCESPVQWAVHLSASMVSSAVVRMFFQTEWCRAALHSDSVSSSASHTELPRPRSISGHLGALPCRCPCQSACARFLQALHAPLAP